MTTNIFQLRYAKRDANGEFIRNSSDRKLEFVIIGKYIGKDDKEQVWHMTNWSCWGADESQIIKDDDSVYIRTDADLGYTNDDICYMDDNGKWQVAESCGWKEFDNIKDALVYMMFHSDWVVSNWRRELYHEHEYTARFASIIRKQLFTEENMTTIFSWGWDGRLQVDEYQLRPALNMWVNGFYHKGKVRIIYNESDLYDIQLFDGNEKIYKTEYNVTTWALCETLDHMVERGDMTQEEYINKVFDEYLTNK